MNNTTAFFLRIMILGVVSLLAGAERGGLLCAAVRASEVSEVLIDFEHLPNGSETGSGPIGDDYAEWGIHFQTIGVDTSKSPKYSRFLHDSTYADCGACSYPPGFNIVADFDTPAYGISAYVTSVAGATVTMTARDARGAIVDSVTSDPIPDAYTFVGPVELSPGRPFTFVEWWPSSSDCGVGVDDLRIVVENTSPPGAGPLVAYWDFNEGRGNIAHDVSGHDNHGTLSGPVAWAAGHEGPGLRFAGIDNYLRVENSPELNPTTALTLAVWINPTWSFHNRILQKEDGDNQYRLLKEHGDNMVFDLAGVTNGRLEHNVLPPTGEWTHLAATYDGSAMKLYYNAELVDSHAASGAINTSTKPLTIGSKHPGAPAGDEYRGLMDELRIYDCALNAREVQALAEWTPARGIQITNVQIMRGEFVAGEFQEIEEVDRVQVGDLFQIVVRVSNLGSTTETIGNLYGYEMSGQGRMELTGQPCVGLYPVELDPGESATLYPFCPQSQAFEAKAAGHVDMDIAVSENCQDTFGFEIASPSDGGLEITDVKIMRGEFIGGAFQELEEVDEVIVGDVFQVTVKVTNTGDTARTVGNLYQYILSGQGDAQLVGQLCVGVYPIHLGPGASAWLDAFCPATQAFQAIETGWVTMAISVDLDCDDTFTFQIVPEEEAGLTVTDITLIRQQLVDGVYEDIGTAGEVTVGDFFRVEVEVTNQGDTARSIGSRYGWSFSGQGSVAQVGAPFCIGLYLIDLAPGESAVVDALCRGMQSFQATEAGWVTMDISVELDCEDTFTFQIVPEEEEDGLTVTGTTLIRQQLVDGLYEDIGTASSVTVGDFFRVEVEVTNQGDTTRSIGSRYGWSFSGQGSVAQVGAPFCIGFYLIDLAPGESAVVDALCRGMQAFQATEAGWVTMEISVELDCEDTFTFQIGSL
jgi:hypothetical protein